MFSLSRLTSRLQRWARQLKRDVMTLWCCACHPDTPWWLRALLVCVVAYALSPIDLIPDFIPVLGYLDDLLLLPLGIWLAIRLMPPAILSECRAQALAWENTPRSISRAGAAAVVLIWVLTASALAYWLSTA
ncbi:YkvA family protein [Stutzerimonas stutzeri]|jgi:uncharacterized membrane protein YkvA (DUF1232 family)|uniref:DUF1232 domain-containing protein n=1 Tax=Stutzerimonas stutzeri TaxID=316 RepID=A0A172WQZ7_STUST|nr:DUF1232 domain-containing protein [Stutzerimonas stutzeri]ANF25715.1 hypothetical protein PS273GM_11440 [Stutzerimonas stutzeri]